MRHTIDFVDDPDGVIVHAFGRADIEGFRALNDDLVSNARFRPGMQILLDQTHLDVSELTLPDMDEIGKHVRTLADRIGPSPVAIVATDALTRLAVQAFADDSGSAGLRPQIVETMSEGIRWLARQEPAA
jgi:hypothetical protein